MKTYLLKTAFLHLLIFTFFSIQAQDTINKFVFSGKITGQDTGYVWLSYLNRAQKFIQDSVRLDNGRFAFSGFIDVPTVASFKGTRSRHVDDPNFTDVFLEPVVMNAVVKVNNFKHMHVTGSATQTAYEKVNDQKEPVNREMLPLDSAFERNRRAVLKDMNNADLNAKDDSLRALYKPFNERLNQIEYQFIATHPSSYLSAYYMFYDLEQLSPDSAKELYSGLSPAIQQSFYGKKVSSRLQAKEVTAIGKTAQDFYKKEMSGKDISLASFKGKHTVLLDFWASWCGPCRRGNPQLIALYQKYHNKGLEIISISVDKDTAAWQEAVAKDKIDRWHHVLDAGLAASFNATVVPTQLLIDKNGIIIGRYEGFDPNEKESDLDRKLAELMIQN